jgi:hypothetical protein
MGMNSGWNLFDFRIDIPSIKLNLFQLNPALQYSHSPLSHGKLNVAKPICFELAQRIKTGIKSFLRSDALKVTF